MKHIAIYILLFLAFSSCQTAQRENKLTNKISPVNVKVAKAPINEVLNHDFRVNVEGFEVPVYNSRVSVVPVGKDVSELPSSYELAAFAYFDLEEGSATVNVGYKESIRSVRFVTAGKAPVPDFHDNMLSFIVDEPLNLSVIINNDSIHVLSLFINPKEEDKPDPKDPKVVYFAPGSYRLPSAALEDGMTVYVAAGAVVHCYVGPHEWYTVNTETGLKNYSPFYMLDLNGNHIKVRGRGIIDADNTPLNSRRGIRIKGEDISLEGVIIRNSSECAIFVDSASHVDISNVKVLNYRFNANGIQTTPTSQDVTMNESYIRAQIPLDDVSNNMNISNNTFINLDNNNH